MGTDSREGVWHHFLRAAAAAAEVIPTMAVQSSELGSWAPLPERVRPLAEVAEVREDRRGWQVRANATARSHVLGWVGLALLLDVVVTSRRVISWVPFGRGPANADLQATR